MRIGRSVWIIAAALVFGGAQASPPVQATLALGNGTAGIAIDPAIAKAFVTNQDSATVSVIDINTLTVVAIIPSNILFEAALSYLSIGIPQGTPSWGRMISEASNGQLYTIAWWMLFFPGMALVLTTLAFNLVGDGLRDALDPRTQVTG